MNSNEFGATPTVADESSTVVDDDEVISRTLPSALMPQSAGRLQEQVDHVLNVIRGCVIRQPIRAVLVAAAGGASLTALLVAWMQREDI